MWRGRARKALRRSRLTSARASGADAAICWRSSQPSTSRQSACTRAACISRRTGSAAARTDQSTSASPTAMVTMRDGGRVPPVSRSAVAE